MDSTKRRKKGKHVKELDSISVDPASASGFNFGYFYRSIEDHIVAYAAQAGGENTFSDIASELSRLLEAASIRERMGGSELVPQMRQDSQGNMRGRPARLHADDIGAAPDVHVRARDGRPLKRRLSAEARARISEAQHARWDKFKAAQQRNREAARLRYHRKQGHKAKSEKRKNYSEAAKGYWYNMTPEERSAEMTRRRQVAAAKRGKK